MSSSSRLQRLRAFIVAERWTIAIVLAALLVRLHWSLVAHPLGEYIYSDMNGYNSRAERLVREPWGHYEYHAFFPFGTHLLAAVLKAMFGMQNFAAIGVVYALLGTACVLAAHRIALRVGQHRPVAHALGLLLVFYYPHLSTGGYLLSELPFSACFLLATWCSIRLVDEGRMRDAVLMGVCAGLGAWFRPQILMSVGLLGLYWLWRRKAMPKLRLVHLVGAGIPLALLLGLSAAHFRYQTGRNGLVSENGPFNMVFGRCHNSKIESLPDGKGHGKVHFRPPEFLQLNNLLDRARKEGRKPQVQLNPVIGDVLHYPGYIGDTARHNQYIRECLAKTTIGQQLQYTWLNVALLWRYNIPWPDSGRGQWREPARAWTKVYEVAFAIPSLLFLVTLVRRRWVRQGWLAVHLVAIIVTAALYFGGTRHRASYDPLLLFFAFEVYAAVGVWSWRRFRAWRHRRRAGGGDAAAPVG
ncbi:MAG: glycosyltransferase family 39 protein [Nannocystaceae bacterium]|nr:glycosyltransferase family 39 protein [Nannocystaceae bacterium]